LAQLKNEMPQVVISDRKLRVWGKRWRANSRTQWTRAGKGAGKKLARVTKAKNADSFTRKESVNFGYTFDSAFGKSLASFLGDIKVCSPQGDSLLPVGADCVEVGAVRVVGGIRPQNYDAAYRPDGPRVVLDSKSLNDRASIRKNWQNMINDLATEAATIHTRFPYAVVAFMVILPKPALDPKQAADIQRTLERLGTRDHVLDEHHLAEAVALIVWDPDSGQIDNETPLPTSNVSLQNFSATIGRRYTDRYKGLPPHSFALDAIDEEEATDEG